MMCLWLFVMCVFARSVFFSCCVTCIWAGVYMCSVQICENHIVVPKPQNRGVCVRVFMELCVGVVCGDVRSAWCDASLM